jgi:hypothetical protein
MDYMGEEKGKSITQTGTLCKADRQPAIFKIVKLYLSGCSQVRCGACPTNISFSKNGVQFMNWTPFLPIDWGIY